jgi:hypothetical protein
VELSLLKHLQLKFCTGPIGIVFEYFDYSVIGFPQSPQMSVSHKPLEQLFATQPGPDQQHIAGYVQQGSRAASTKLQQQ